MNVKLKPMLLSLLLLSACNSANKNEDVTVWENFDNTELSVSFEYPEMYEEEPVQDTEITIDDSTFSVKEAVLRAGDGEASFISVMKTSDPKVLEYVSQENAFQTQSFNGKEFLKFHQEGMGDPIGYIINEGSFYVALTFVFPPDKNIVNHIMDSVIIK